MEHTAITSNKKLQVNLVKKGNLKDAKYIIIDDLSKVTMKQMHQQAKNKFKQAKFNTFYAMETQQVISSDQILEQVLSDFSCIYHQEQDKKPILTFVFCPEKELILTPIDNIEGLRVPSQEIQMGKVDIIAKDTLVEEEAIRQLQVAAKLKGCLYAYGMPDLHPGKGIPIGASIITEGIIYPELVDYDIGCGMCFIKTGINTQKISQKRLDQLSSNIKSIDCPWTSQEDKIKEFLEYEFSWGGNKVEKLNIDDLEKKHLQVLGTIGGGNHFAEFQEVTQIIDNDAFSQLGLDPNEVFMLVHSGSRSLGESILGKFLEESKGSETKGTLDTSDEFMNYLKGHNLALNFARRNRFLIAHRILEQIDSRKQTEEQPFAIKEQDCIVDIYHNFVERCQIREEDDKIKDVWIHRKGATPSTHSEVLVIPGSRGSYSYLVKVVKENTAKSGYSLAHGAGRKMNRSKALAISKSQNPNPHNLLKTDLDSIVVCENKTLIYEEAPIAYKNIDNVIRDLVELGFVRVIAQLKPILTYKFKEPGFKDKNH